LGVSPESSGALLMRILAFAQQLAAFRSGVGTYAFGLLTGLAAQGHEVTAVVPEDQKTALPGVRVVAIRQRRLDPSPGGWMSLGSAFARFLARQGKAFDVAHFTDAREAWRVRRSPIPVAGMVNDSYALDWCERSYPRHIFADRAWRSLYYRLLRAVEVRTYRSLRAVIANSRHVAHAVRVGYRVDPGRTHVIYYGLPDFSPAPPVRLQGRPSVLFAGGNFQRKGLPTLLSAAARVRTEMPDVCVHVVGRDRNQPVLARLARELGCAQHVQFHGFQPNDRVRGMMSGADVFALPSLTEGFGLVYLEAMKAGVPVVATSSGGASEVLEDGAEALFVAPNDPGALARAIRALVTNPALAERLRTGGRAAAARFDAATMAAKTEEVFSRLLEVQPAARDDAAVCGSWR
jgi:glycosyltransferase involved in cell wall biosynthesis